jgi:hypothetical protein
MYSQVRFPAIQECVKKKGMVGSKFHEKDARVRRRPKKKEKLG